MGSELDKTGPDVRCSTGQNANEEMQMTETTGKSGLELAAYELGKDHAEAAATWIADGNTDAEHCRAVLRLMEDGDPLAEQYMPQRPDLSGVWADSLTPRGLAYEIGEDPDDLGDQLEGLCEEYEEAVSEHFEMACERELRKHVGPARATVPGPLVHPAAMRSQFDDTEEIRVPCEYFALCDRAAEVTLPHPILEHVPTCSRCAVKVARLEYC